MRLSTAKKQWILAIGLSILVLILSGAIAWLLFKEPIGVRPTPKSPKKSLATGASRVNPQEVWVHDFKIQSDLTQKRVESIEQSLDKILKLNQAPVRSSNNELSSALPEAMDGSESSNNQRSATPTAPGTLFKQPAHVSDHKNTFKKNLFRSKNIQKITLSLFKNRSATLLKTTDNTIPAGSFARAVLLSGVDASTSINAASDPRPITLRLIDPGTLPRQFHSDLEGCHVIAAAYGDLSSERVFMRLETLSCVERKTAEVIEIAVKGAVSGEDGRAGIRGTVIDRAGPHMRSAIVGGFFSSMGKFLGQDRSPLLFSPSMGFSQNNPLSTNDILKQSAGSGMSGALEKYADFYIKRAEQMQPVIQVAAGRIVDITFAQGVEFSDSLLRQHLSKSNDQKRLQKIHQPQVNAISADGSSTPSEEEPSE